MLETRVGSTGTILETATREARRRKAQVRNVASSAGGVQSRTTGAQEGFCRCRTPGEAAGSSRINSELCARCRATSVADGNAQKVSVEVRSDPAAEPIGVPSGRGPYQVVQLRLGSTGLQCPPDDEGA